MTHRDPGEQARGSGRHRTKAVGTAGTQIDVFAPPAAPLAEGKARKAAALDNHESGHEDRLTYIRAKLVELYDQRRRTADPSAGNPFVTADDAAKILDAAANLGYTDDVGDDAKARTWFGAIFRTKEWETANPPGWVPSIRPAMNARMIRCWKPAGR